MKLNLDIIVLQGFSQKKMATSESVLFPVFLLIPALFQTLTDIFYCRSIKGSLQDIRSRSMPCFNLSSLDDGMLESMDSEGFLPPFKCNLI